MKRFALLLSAALMIPGSSLLAYAFDEQPEPPAVEEPKAEEPKAEEPQPEPPAEEPKPEEPKPEQPAEEPKPEEPKPEEPKPEQPAEEPKPEEPKPEEPKPEEPKPEQPKPEEPKPEEPKPEQPKPEEPKPEEPKPEQPKPEEPKPEEPKPEEPKPEQPAAEVKAPETLVTNLENPSGVAIHSGTGHIFVASRYGVYRYDPANHKIAIEVAGYPVDVYGKGPMYNIGPLGVAFLNEEHLIVGDGSRPDGEELVRVYKIAPELPAKFRKEETAEITLGPIKAGEQSAKGEGNFYQLAVNGKAVFITSNGDDTKGWVLKTTIGEDGKPGELTPTIATKEATGVDAPVGITFSPEGDKLVIGQMGEVNVAGDSLLTFYNPETGELISKHETGLSDIAGLAYSPKTGKLYAVDFSWADPTKGGLFRLDIAEDKVTATKVYDLDKPTSLAFDKDGKLYVTVFNSAKEGENEKSAGTLIVFEAGL